MPSMSSATTSNPLRCGKKQRSLCAARFRSLELTATVQRRAIRDLSRVAMDGLAQACAVVEIG
jgi:hypothetical protein